MTDVLYCKWSTRTGIVLAALSHYCTLILIEDFTESTASLRLLGPMIAIADSSGHAAVKAGRLQVAETEMQKMNLIGSLVKLYRTKTFIMLLSKTAYPWIFHSVPKWHIILHVLVSKVCKSSFTWASSSDTALPSIISISWASSRRIVRCLQHAPELWSLGRGGMPISKIVVALDVVITVHGGTCRAKMSTIKYRSMMHWFKFRKPNRTAL